MRLRSTLFSLSLAALVACGGGDSDPNASDASTGADADPTQVDASTPEGYDTILSASWSKAAGTDSYYCAWKTLTEDIYINSFAAMAPVGTHHTVLSVTNTKTGSGQESCGTGDVGEQLLFASGVGTEPLELPEGVALKVAAGTTIHLQLHLFNASDNQLSGESGTAVRSIPAADVVQEAEFFLAGTLNFAIPGNGVDYKATGGCSVEADGTLIAMWPHMHMLGTHMKIDLEGSMLHDGAYSFDEQKFYALQAPLAVSAGDQIGVECTWNNPSGSTVTFGNGDSTDEMCFAGFYRYPAVGSDPFCGLLN